MATTKIWKIEKRLDHVLTYTSNVEKTFNKNYGTQSKQIVQVITICIRWLNMQGQVIKLNNNYM